MSTLIPFILSGYVYEVKENFMYVLLLCLAFECLSFNFLLQIGKLNIEKSQSDY